MSSFTIESVTSNESNILSTENAKKTVQTDFLHKYGQFIMDIDIKQMDKGQDRGFINITSIESDEKFAYALVLDGHGPNPVLMDTICNLDINSIMVSQSPCETAFNLLKNHPEILINSGSTMNSVKLFENRIECESMGDSTTIILINGEIVYQNKCHNSLNNLELIRLLNQGSTRPGMMPVVSGNATTITMKSSPIFVFTNIPSGFGCDIELTLVPTQSIGHRGVTGCEPDKFCVKYDALIDEVICLVMTDGVSDMLNFIENKNDLNYLITHTSTEIVELAESRWRQGWIYEGRENTYFPTKNGYDDLTMCRLIYKPNNV
jgi:serine/threonine protein phosphatase PrpC